MSEEKMQPSVDEISPEEPSEGQLSHIFDEATLGRLFENSGQRLQRRWNAHFENHERKTV